MIVALLGAACTGKSTLALALQRSLAAQGRRVARVAEVLREFCDVQGRTPRRHEQAGIAAEQTRRIAAAAMVHDIVVADTTALQVAVVSDFVFGDRSLYDEALRAQSRYHHTLLCAPDLPQDASGTPAREAVDALLRSALQQHARGFAVIGGRGEARTAAALAALQPRAPAAAARWQSVCERCGDPDCERHLLPR